MSKSNIIEELAEENRILELQRKYENGSIKEQELTSDEKIKLEELYKKQIKTLDENKEMYEKQLLDYKQRIVKIRKKLQKLT